MNILYILDDIKQLDSLSLFIDEMNKMEIYVTLISSEEIPGRENVVILDTYKKRRDFIKHNEKRFDIVQVNINSSLYFFACHISKRCNAVLLADCEDFSASYSLPSLVKKSSTLISYFRHLLLLNKIDFVMVNSIAGKKRIDDMGIRKRVFILSPYYGIKKKSRQRSVTRKNEKVGILFDSSLFKGEEIVQFVNDFKSLPEKYYQIIVIDSSTSDFASLYSVDSNHIFSSKDYNREDIYQKASYIYSHRDKIDNYDYYLGYVYNKKIVTSLSAFYEKSVDKNQIDSDIEYVKKEFSFEKHLSSLRRIYENIERSNY